MYIFVYLLFDHQDRRSILWIIPYNLENSGNGVIHKFDLVL